MSLLHALCDINESVVAMGTTTSLHNRVQRHKYDKNGADAELNKKGMYEARLEFLAKQDSLGGNAKTALICNISPAVAFAQETQITLEFATRAKQMKNKVWQRPSWLCCL